MFFLLFNSVLSADCDFKKANSFANTLKSLGSPSATLFSGKFGLSKAPDSLGDAIDDNKYIEYIAGNVGLGAIMLVFFVLLLLYSIIGFIFFCCCCKPKKNEKCKLFSIPTLCHLITTTLLAISVIFFFLSASTISNGIGDVSEIPNSTIGGIDDLTNIIEVAAVDTLDAINGTVKESNQAVTEYIKLLERGRDVEYNKANLAEGHMDSYNDIFTAGSVENEKYSLYTKNGEVEDVDTIKARFDESSSYKCSNDRALAIAGMVHNYQLITSRIYSAIKSMQLSVSSNDLQTAITTSTNNQNTNMKNMKDHLDDTRQNQINPMIDKLRKVSTDIHDTLSPIKSTLDTVRTSTRVVVIAATCFYAIIIFLLAAAYLFNSCWARCIVRFDWCFFILIDFLIILPGSIFAVVYFVFYDTCPNLETTFGSFLGSALPFQKDEIKAILLCPEEQPLYDMANMSGFFDKNKFVKDISDSIKGDNINIETGDLSTTFNDFGHGLKVNDISGNMMWWNYLIILNPEIEPEHESTCTNMLIDFLGKIRNTVNEQKLTDVKENMNSVMDFGTQVKPQTDNVNNEINKMQDNIPKVADDKLDEGLDKITCMITRCMYSPIKNPVCNTVINGFAEWIISSILAIVGIVIWSVLFIFRRKNMAKPQVAGNDGF